MTKRSKIIRLLLHREEVLIARILSDNYHWKKIERMKKQLNNIYNKIKTNK